MVWNMMMNTKVAVGSNVERGENGVCISVEKRTGVHSSLVVSLHKTNKHTCWVNELQLGN